jgi:hypothetical protein
VPGDAGQCGAEALGVAGVAEHPGVLEPVRGGQPAQVEQPQVGRALGEPGDRGGDGGGRGVVGQLAVGQLEAAQQVRPVPADPVQHEDAVRLGLTGQSGRGRLHHDGRYLRELRAELAHRPHALPETATRTVVRGHHLVTHTVCPMTDRDSQEFASQQPPS